MVKYKQGITVTDLEIILVQNGFREELDKIKRESEKLFPHEAKRQRFYQRDKFDEIYKDQCPFIQND